MANTFNHSLRMPIELGDTIYSLSKESKIPMNTYIIIMLESSLKEKVRKRKTQITLIPRTKRKSKEPTLAKND